jgi:hypothetical protein
MIRIGTIRIIVSNGSHRRALRRIKTRQSSSVISIIPTGIKSWANWR